MNHSPTGATRHLRSLLLAFASLLLLASSPTAWAMCMLTPGFPGFKVPFNLGAVAIQPDVAVGAVIATKQVPLSIPAGGMPTSVCIYGGTMTYALGPDNPAPTGIQSVWATNVPGIGIRVVMYSAPGPGGGGGTYAYPGNTPYALDLNIPTLVLYYYPGSYYQIDLVKTAATTGSGSLAPGVYARQYGDDGLDAISLSVAANAVTIVSPTCKVDAGSLNVPVDFGQVPLKAFSGPGSVAQSRSFKIQLNCSAGVGTTNNIYMTMDGTPDPSGSQGVLQITQGAGAASGVGIQLLDAFNMPVEFKKAQLVGPSMDGSYTVPYTARYYQTGPKVTPGAANGTANFTVSYQ